MYAKLGSCLCMVRGIGDHSIAKWKSHPLLVRTMRSEKGSATVTVALFGVSPNRWRGRFQSPSGAPRRVLPTRRRDADESGRDDRAPHLQLHCSGLAALPMNQRVGHAYRLLPSVQSFATPWAGETPVLLWIRSGTPAQITPKE